METDLFGVPLAAAATHRPPSAPVRKIGYAARPGTGPKGQRCNTCRLAQRVTHREERSWKCEVMAGIWHLGAASDIVPGAPACSEFERKPFRAESFRGEGAQ